MELKSGAGQGQTLAAGSQPQEKNTTNDNSTIHNAQAPETHSESDIVARIAELQREAFSLGTAALVCTFPPFLLLLCCLPTRDSVNH